MGGKDKLNYETTLLITVAKVAMATKVATLATKIYFKCNTKSMGLTNLVAKSTDLATKFHSELKRVATKVGKYFVE